MIKYRSKKLPSNMFYHFSKQASSQTSDDKSHEYSLSKLNFERRLKPS